MTANARAASVLVVCSGNICRSPLVEAMLRHRLAGSPFPADVTSAGTIDWNAKPMADHSVQVLVEYGIDPGGHRSRKLTADLLRSADLVVGMSREHQWAVDTLAPEAMPYTFLLGELVRLGEKFGPRGALSGDEWIAGVDATRPANRLARPGDELDDPMGEPIEAFRVMGGRAADLTARLVALLTN
ncbi:low molecular weight phosphotyrosine protein phosphatase [Streptomyces sp. SID3343]|uniref:arsenate reductase/protein-tyrosine-phosphatase family protein n=1 Tax=Streptomyces sp. SID3343 TaxID=2690260 RepID=UPI00136C394D|nr:low molecular weight phosphotyrosine protein phosphatase [Streptomyces sp. SID3343]